MIEAVVDAWRDVLTMLDGQRPVVAGEVASEWPEATLTALMSAGVLTEIAPARSLACPECAEAPFGEVVWTEVNGTGPRTLLPCPHCGLVDVPFERLRRWQVEKPAIEELIRRSLNLTGRRGEDGTARLRRLGRLGYGGTDWSVLLGYHLARKDAGDLLSRVPWPPRTLLLVPAQPPSCALPGGVIPSSLRDLTEWQSGSLHWDVERLAELLHVPEAASRPPRKPAPTRRQTRAADIDALAAELRQHLRAARDYAYQTRDVRGAAALLPRPTQKDLARRLGITESRVSRSLRDARATELRLLWQLAEDVDQVLRFVS